MDRLNRYLVHSLLVPLRLLDDLNVAADLGINFTEVRVRVAASRQFLCILNQKLARVDFTSILDFLIL